MDQRALARRGRHPKACRSALGPPTADDLDVLAVPQPVPGRVQEPRQLQRLASPVRVHALGAHPCCVPAGGVEMSRLDERFQEFEVARIGPDGKLVRTCVQGPARAAAAQQAKPAPAKELQ